MKQNNSMELSGVSFWTFQIKMGLADPHKTPNPDASHIFPDFLQEIKNESARDPPPEPNPDFPDYQQVIGNCIPHLSCYRGSALQSPKIGLCRTWVFQANVDCGAPKLDGQINIPKHLLVTWEKQGLGSEGDLGPLLGSYRQCKEIIWKS